MTYSQLIETITPSAVISFKEYELDRHERKKLKLSIENALVHAVIPANEPIPRRLLEDYYGENLSNRDYIQLSLDSCFRIVLLMGIGEDGLPMYMPLSINQDFYELGLQEVEILQVATSEPIYAPNLYRTENAL